MQEKGKLPKILGNDLPLNNYPDNSITEAIERKIELKLPVIDGLNDPALPGTERLAILKKATDMTYQSFVRAHGDPFGEAITQFDAQIELPEEDLLLGELSSFSV